MAHVGSVARRAVYTAQGRVGRRSLESSATSIQPVLRACQPTRCWAALEARRKALRQVQQLRGDSARRPQAAQHQWKSDTSASDMVDGQPVFTADDVIQTNGVENGIEFPSNQIEGLDLTGSGSWFSWRASSMKWTSRTLSTQVMLGSTLYRLE